MKRLFYFSLSFGVILVIVAFLFKEMHWAGKKELTLAAIGVLLFVMALYLYSLIKYKKKITD